MISPTRGTQSSQIPRDRKENGGCQGLWEGAVGNYCLMGTVSVWEDEKVPEMDSKVAQQCELPKATELYF